MSLTWRAWGDSYHRPEVSADLRTFFQLLFANRIAAFFGLDVIVSSIVLWVVVLVDSRRNQVPHAWAPLLGNLLVGVSLGLPLWLYLREVRLIEMREVHG